MAGGGRRARDHERRGELGEDLARARRRAKLSQRELAERLGLSQAAISRVESGERLPRLETLSEWARATGHRLEIQLKRARRRDDAPA